MLSIWTLEVETQVFVFLQNYKGRPSCGSPRKLQGRGGLQNARSSSLRSAAGAPDHAWFQQLLFRREVSALLLLHVDGFKWPSFYRQKKHTF